MENLVAAAVLVGSLLTIGLLWHVFEKGIKWMKVGGTGGKQLLMYNLTDDEFREFLRIFEEEWNFTFVGKPYNAAKQISQMLLKIPQTKSSDEESYVDVTHPQCRENWYVMFLELNAVEDAGIPGELRHKGTLTLSGELLPSKLGEIGIDERKVALVIGALFLLTFGVFYVAFALIKYQAPKMPAPTWVWALIPAAIIWGVLAARKKLHEEVPANKYGLCRVFGKFRAISPAGFRLKYPCVTKIRLKGRDFGQNDPEGVFKADFLIKGAFPLFTERMEIDIPHPPAPDDETQDGQKKNKNKGAEGEESAPLGFVIEFRSRIIDVLRAGLSCPDPITILTGVFKTAAMKIGRILALGKYSRSDWECWYDGDEDGIAKFQENPNQPSELVPGEGLSEASRKKFLKKVRMQRWGVPLDIQTHADVVRRALAKSGLDGRYQEIRERTGLSMEPLAVVIDAAGVVEDMRNELLTKRYEQDKKRVMAETQALEDTMQAKADLEVEELRGKAEEARLVARGRGYRSIKDAAGVSGDTVIQSETAPRVAGQLKGAKVSILSSKPGLELANAFATGAEAVRHQLDVGSAPDEPESEDANEGAQENPVEDEENRPRRRGFKPDGAA